MEGFDYVLGCGDIRVINVDVVRREEVSTVAGGVELVEPVASGIGRDGGDKLRGVSWGLKKRLNGLGSLLRRHCWCNARIGVVRFIEGQEVWRWVEPVNQLHGAGDVGLERHHGDLTCVGSEAKSQPVAGGGLELRKLRGCGASIEDDVDEVRGAGTNEVSIGWAADREDIGTCHCAAAMKKKLASKYIIGEKWLKLVESGLRYGWMRNTGINTRSYTFVVVTRYLQADCPPS